jgi:hypothetical protein
MRSAPEDDDGTAYTEASMDLFRHRDELVKLGYFRHTYIQIPPATQSKLPSLSNVLLDRMDGEEFYFQIPMMPSPSSHVEIWGTPQAIRRAEDIVSGSTPPATD